MLWPPAGNTETRSHAFLEAIRALSQIADKIVNDCRLLVKLLFVKGSAMKLLEPEYRISSSNAGLFSPLWTIFLLVMICSRCKSAFNILCPNYFCGKWRNLCCTSQHNSSILEWTDLVFIRKLPTKCMTLFVPDLMSAIKYKITVDQYKTSCAKEQTLDNELHPKMSYQMPQGGNYVFGLKHFSVVHFSSFAHKESEH